MSKFKVGDRIAVYTPYGRSSLTVVSIHSDGNLQVETVNGTSFPVHPKQCRRLMPKKRRCVWIREVRYPTAGGSLEKRREIEFTKPKTGWNANEPQDWIEYREVKKK